jgi:hypothetical protein
MFRNRIEARRSGLTRALAAVLGITLIVASIAPPFALAESDREGEGTAPPGAVPPGLQEGPDYEPGGEETSLEATPIVPGEEAVEEVVEEVLPAGAEGTEPTPPPAGAPPAATESPAPAPEAPPPVPTVTEPQPDPALPAPDYGTESSSPSYQTSPASAAPVENEPIVAPGGGGAASTQAPHRSQSKAAGPSPGTQPPPAEEPQPVPVWAPEPAVSPPSVPGHRPGTLNGRGSYTVVEGDDLWAIAEGILPDGAGNAEISAEVSRLWRLNSQAIGTGNPNLILVGTVLRLH